MLNLVILKNNVLERHSYSFHLCRAEKQLMWKPRDSTQRDIKWNSVQRGWQDPLQVCHRLRPGWTFAPHLCEQCSWSVSVGLSCANLQRWVHFISWSVWFSLTRLAAAAAACWLCACIVSPSHWEPLYQHITHGSPGIFKMIREMCWFQPLVLVEM